MPNLLNHSEQYYYVKVIKKQGLDFFVFTQSFANFEESSKTSSSVIADLPELLCDY